MTTHVLTRHGDRTRPALPILEGMALDRARVHEVCGPARRTFALIVARATAGEVLWIRPAWTPERLYPPAVTAFIDPGRLILVTPKRAEDLLWAAEEGLRAGAVALVVADLIGPPGLTPVRRLHLAAETGAAEGRQTPLGLILTPGDGGAAGVETRWHMAPRHGEDVTRWRLERRRARVLPPKGWTLTQAASGALSLGEEPPGDSGNMNHSPMPAV